MVKRKKREISYGTDIFDMTMALDESANLNLKGIKKRMSWKRRGLI